MKEEQKIEPKKIIKEDFIPEENFTWDLDLEATNKKSKKKGKKGKQTVEANVVKNIVKKPTYIPAEIRLKFSNEIDFEITSLNKVNKGLTNNTNCCFMNVCL